MPAAPPVPPEGGAEFRDAQRAVSAAADTAEHVGSMLPQMAALREQLRELRETNHFSERFAEMLGRGYEPPPRRGGA